MNLNKDPESWARVSPEAALGGSKAQGENVLKMAIEDIGRLHAELQQAKKPTKRAKPGAVEHVAEINRLRAWVDDLQSGMHVNCVYCGFRYGPGETTPVSMADALKAHVNICPEHPMSKYRSAIERARGCFSAAVVEGLYTVLAETGDERLRDLIERRIMYADATLAETGLEPIHT